MGFPYYGSNRLISNSTVVEKVENTRGHTEIQYDKNGLRCSHFDRRRIEVQSLKEKILRNSARCKYLWWRGEKIHGIYNLWVVLVGVLRVLYIKYAFTYWHTMCFNLICGSLSCG